MKDKILKAKDMGWRRGYRDACKNISKVVNLKITAKNTVSGVELLIKTKK